MEKALSVLEIRAIIPRATVKMLAVIERYGLTRSEVQTIKDVLENYHVSLHRAVTLLDEGLTVQEIAEVIDAYTDAESLKRSLSYKQIARAFMLCGGDRAVLDAFLNAAYRYVMEEERPGHRFVYLLNRIEQKFDGDIMGVMRVLCDNDPDEIHEILRGGILKDASVKDFFEGDWDEGEEDN